MITRITSNVARSLLLCLIFVGSSVSGEAQSPYAFEANVKIPMSDGTQLAANIFRPNANGRWPVILIRTPYGKQDEKWPGGGDYAAKGYVTVVQDCRGRGNSEGTWEPFLNEAQDGFDTQEWVATQPWCDGNIGTAGGSYVGCDQHHIPAPVVTKVSVRATLLNCCSGEVA